MKMNAVMVGDVHGKWDQFKSIAEKATMPVFQVGDFGFGLRNRKPNIKGDWRFIRGNHDDPSLAKKDSHYAGDFGVWNGVFFVSGAASIDVGQRTTGVDWWPDEQLNYTQMQEAYNLYVRFKPKIVITHDCPDHFKSHFMTYVIKRSSTGVLLNALYEFHEPELWVFGHHHKSQQTRFGKTMFVGLRELETQEIEWTIP